MDNAVLSYLNCVIIIPRLIVPRSGYKYEDIVIM